ncbi:hypothetical protein [Geofilum rhodophaeum]|uniref:hypothetical protein n=1 Tax=Geofilum rhodophaeum TaxID=1965019 RepID=UPI000B51FE88|nr:hypothetical protein [Geofilum rhodophaeum]
MRAFTGGLKRPLLFVFGLFVFGSLVAQNNLAQDSFKSYSELGARGGYSLASSYIVDRNASEDFSGPYIGGRFVFFGEKYLGLMAEVNYSRLQRSDAEYGSLAYSYFQVPFMTKVRVPIRQTAVVFNLGSYVQFVSESSAPVVNERSALFGLAGGLEFVVPIGTWDLALEGRYANNLHSNSTRIDNLWTTWMEFGLIFSWSAREKN